MSSARDAVWDAIQSAYSTNGKTEAVLAALCIPADADADDVRAGIARMRWNMGMLTHRIDGSWEAWTSTFDGSGTGDTPAAAVLALADKLAAQEATDA